MNLLLAIPVIVFFFSGAAPTGLAQPAVPPATATDPPLADGQLDQLLGPIALYPDPLIAIILPASTVPAQIVLADRYVSGGGDPNQLGQQPWDASIKALARCTNVLKWMDDNLTWTSQLGQTFLNQQGEVMKSIQRLRASASRLGNLQSSPQQQVVADAGNIEIVPADPQLIYVPAYQPAQVYYDAAVGSPFITFGIGWPMGPWLGYDCDWGGGGIIFWGRDHPRPFNWWHESARERGMGQAAAWGGGHHPGAFAGNHGDRGWRGSSMTRSAAPALTGQNMARSGAWGAARASSGARTASGSFVRSAPISRPVANGAFNGIHSSSLTRSFSARGQSSIRSAGRASFGGGGRGGSGGGGSRGGGGRR